MLFVVHINEACSFSVVDINEACSFSIVDIIVGTVTVTLMD